MLSHAVTAFWIASPAEEPIPRASKVDTTREVMLPPYVSTLCKVQVQA
jgi:hypothetical protein